MALFLSTSVNKIDKKGRVSVPAGFRAALEGEAFSGIVLIPSQTHDCLEGFAYSAMQEIARRLDEFDMFSTDQDDLAASVFGEAVQLAFDGEGRIMIGTDLLARATLSDQAVFVGMGAKFQIWSPEKYEERRCAARENVTKNKLTLPKGGGA
jgi:MraZ protein